MIALRSCGAGHEYATTLMEQIGDFGLQTKNCLPNRLAEHVWLNLQSWPMIQTAALSGTEF